MSIGAGRTVADLKTDIDAHIRQQMRNARINGNTGDCA